MFHVYAILCFLSIGFVLVLLYKVTKSRRHYTNLINKIPGPPLFPIVGNLFDLTRSPDELWLFMRRCAKEYYPIYRLWAFQTNCVCLLTAEDIGIVLSSTVNIEKGPIIYNPLRDWLQHGLLTSTGAKWQSRRKILTPTFYFNILAEFANIFVKETEILVKKLDQECLEDSTNIVPYISETTLNSVAETAMGVKLQDVIDNNPLNYIKSVRRIGQLVTHRIIHPILHPNPIYALTMNRLKERNELKILHGFSRSVINRRANELRVVTTDKRGTEEDCGLRKRVAMLDLLIKKMKDGEIDKNGIQEEVDTFVFEGHDTTSVSICYTLMLLAVHQNVQDKVRQELNDTLGSVDNRPTFQQMQQLPYLERVIKESLRLYPSVPVISRKLSDGLTTSSGYYIPKGVEVLMFLHDLHRDANIWPNPHQFDPDRFLPENVKSRPPFAYVPFSAGPRNCIGQKFGMLEMKIIIAGILRKFSLSPVDTPDSITPVIDLMNKTKNGIIRLKLNELPKYG